MKKSEIRNLKVGDKVMHLKKESVHTITAINEKIELDGKAYSMSTIIRWYIIEEPVKKSAGTNTKEDIEKPSNHLSEGDTHKSDTLTLTKITDLVEELGLTIKVNKTNMAIKYNKKNVMELYPTKKHFNIFVRQEALDIYTRSNLNRHNRGCIVGKSTFALDYSFKTTSWSIFEEVLQKALAYQVNRNTKRVSA